MSAADFLRLKKLTGSGKVKAAARHNRRDKQTEWGALGNIDPTRTALNRTLTGPATADDVADLANARMKAAGIGKLRKDAVRAIEFLFSLSANHGLDDCAYFADCLRWTEARCGGPDNILSADIHRDEAQPHLHVLVLPLVGGRMVGSDMVGGPAKMKAMRTDFHQAVAARYGLAKAPSRLMGATKAAGVAAVLGRLKTGSDSALRSALWPQFRDTIERDPAPYMLALNIEVQRPAQKQRSMTDIFISPGRGPKREANRIGFGSASTLQTLSCVGDAQSATVPQEQPHPAVPLLAEVPRGPAQPAAEGGRVDRLFTRERDAEQDAALYDAETGEFRSRPAKGTRPAAGDCWWSADTSEKADLGS